MTPARFRQCLRVIGWSQASMSNRLDVNDRSIRHWAAGDFRIPADVAAWLETIAAFHERNPPPLRADAGLSRPVPLVDAAAAEIAGQMSRYPDPPSWMTAVFLLGEVVRVCGPAGFYSGTVVEEESFGFLKVQVAGTPAIERVHAFYVRKLAHPG